MSAFIMGLVAHMYKITNWLPNWDSIVFRYDCQNMISLGRWLLGIVCAPSSFYDLPWLVGLLTILFHSLGAVCVCRIFDVKKNITASLIGALIVTFPTVTSVMMYNYVADGYSIAFFFACLAAVFLTEDKPRYVSATVLITLSVGIYQAYITVTIMLLLCSLIVDLVHKNTDIRAVIIKSGKFMAVGIIGMILYYLILMLLLWITRANLLDYQGFNSAITLAGIDIRSSLYVVKHSFMDYFFDFSNDVNIFNFINIVILVLSVVMYLICLIKQKRSVASIVILVIYILLLPIGASVLAFINSAIDYHSLMKMGFFVYYLFIILLYDKTIFEDKKITVVKSWAILALVFALIFTQTVIANISYHKLRMAYEKSYAVLVRIADRIEQTPGSEEAKKVLVVGALEGSEAYGADVATHVIGTTDGYILRSDDEVVGQSVLCSALNDYCGKNYEFVHGEERESFLKENPVANMDLWPGKGSIAVIDDVIVINLGAESEN